MNVIPTADWGSCVKDGVATLACIPIVLQNIINFLILFAGVICVFLIIYAGYKFVMSEGDPEKVGSARKTLTYAIAGLVFIILSFVIMAFVGKFLGVDQIVPK
ncbi:MAG TPA: hypothetical protein VHE53_03230 [Patescibacteria group bacterium]|nr:hypothetical protein [Patescibacteria group bacterium]